MVPGFAESMMGTSTTWEIDWSGLRPFFLGRLCRSLRRIYSSCSWCCYMLLPGVTVLRYVVWYVCVTCVLSFWSYIYLGPPFHVRFFDKRRCEETHGNLIKTTIQNLCHLYLQHMSLRGSRYQYYLWEVEVPLEASPSKDSVFFVVNVCFSFSVHVFFVLNVHPQGLVLLCSLCQCMFKRKCLLKPIAAFQLSKMVWLFYSLFSYSFFIWVFVCPLFSCLLILCLFVCVFCFIVFC